MVEQWKGIQYKLLYSSMKFSESKLHFTKMKTFITVIFFGILTYTVAKKNEPVETCHNNLSIKTGFKIENFFNGVWYTTHMKDATNAATCRAYQFEVTQRGIVLTYEGQITLSDKPKPYDVMCSSTKQPGKPLDPSAPISFYCAQNYTTVYHTPGNEFFDLHFVVIETDYRDYAFLYRCTQYEKDKNSYGMYLLLHRTKNANGDKAKGIVKNYKLDPNTFKQLRC